MPPAPAPPPAACLPAAVTLVGWRDPAVVPGVASHWIVRNSWGTSWGEGGYMRLKMDTVEGSEGLCRSQAYAYYPNTSV